MALRPSISFIVPCFKQANYLLDCLSSLLSQSRTDWEAIVIDDASPDGREIEKVIQAFDDPRIRLVQHEVNKGLAAARNTGARAAKSDYLAFVDADDYVAPDLCQLTVTCLDEAPDLDVVYGSLRLFGDVQADHRARGTSTELQLKLRYWIPGAGVVMRYWVWEAAGGYCEAPLLRTGMEDRDFWIATIPLAIGVAHIPKPLYYWRKYDGSMSTGQEKHYYRLHRFIAKRHAVVLKALNLYDDYLATGYSLSAEAFLREDKWLFSLCLALGGLLRDPGNRRLRTLLVRSLPVPFLRTLSRRIYGRLKSASR